MGICICSRILQSASKNSKKNLDSYCFVTSFGLFIKKQKNILTKISFLLASWRSMTKIAGSGSGSGFGSRSISQRHGSADPDPPQNVMDPQHCLLLMDPDPSIFIIDLQDANKKLIFVKMFFCFLIKSPKEVTKQ